MVNLWLEHVLLTNTCVRIDLSQCFLSCPNTAHKLHETAKGLLLVPFQAVDVRKKTDLHGQSIACMAASVDDVEGWHRQNLQHRRVNQSLCPQIRNLMQMPEGSIWLRQDRQTTQSSESVLLSADTDVGI